MHTAYNLGSLLKLPHAIQSMSAFGEFLLVGTKQGHLLMYSVKFNEPPPGGGSSVVSPDVPMEASVQLLKSNTDYKKPIVQMDVKEIGSKQYILVVLCDGIVAVHYISQKESSVPNISAATRMPHPKGTATAFALDVVRQKTLTGELFAVIRIAVAVRKKLQFFYWKKEKFHELHTEVTIPYEPRSVAWCKDSVCVAFTGGYSLIKLNKSANTDNGICELFSAGIKNEKQVSTVTLLSDERFALAEDKMTKLVDLEGNVSKTGSPIQWSEPPASLAHDSPYLIGLLKKGIELRTDSPSLLIQTLDLPDPKLVCCHRPGLVFIASSSQVWFLRMVSTSKQISQLLIDKEFELALRLCNLATTDNFQQRADRIREIQTLFAFDQFCNGKFKDAMDAFYKLEIDASHVIGLFSDLLPPEFINQLKYPTKPPALEALGRDNAILALIEFLTQVRHKLNGLSSKKLSHRPIVEGPVIESKSKMMEIIDTTLLKCYLQTSSRGLVASLLRLKENQCHLEETEKTLKKHKKFSELIILYNTRGLHRKALNLMKDHVDKPDSPLSGHFKMVEYLQNLTPDQIDIVCEFAPTVFEVSESDGLSIFTEDLLEVEGWPRGKVLEFLTKNEKNSVVPYLEHVVSVWKENGALFHNALILQYKDLIVDLLEKQLLDSDGRQKLEIIQGKLKELLHTSTSYTAETVLPQFPTHCLYEERALLLGSLGRHSEALAIYLYQVRNVNEAFSYCKKHEGSSSIVWTILYRLLVQPPDGPMLRAMNLPKNIQIPEPDMTNALKLLRERGQQVDLMTVVLTTPSSVHLEQLASYLEFSMEKRVSRRHHVQLLRGLMHSQFLQVQEERISVESQKVVLTELDYCPVCHKKFRNQGTLVRYPNGKVVHYSCQERAMMVQ